jgi:hypothetical protein
MIQRIQALTIPRAGTTWEDPSRKFVFIREHTEVQEYHGRRGERGSGKTFAGCDQGRDSNGCGSQWQTFLRLTSGPLAAASRGVSTVRICRGRMPPRGRFPDQQPTSGTSVLPLTEFPGRYLCAKRRAIFTGQSVCKCFSFAFKSMCPWMALPLSPKRPTAASARPS